MSAPRAQPPPVTRVSIGEPPVMRVIRCPSTIASTGPETAATKPWRSDIARAAPRAESTSSAVSGPRPPPPVPASAMISEALPRTTAGSMETRSRARAVRWTSDPTATGSRTQGVPASPAAAAASRAAARCSGWGVPRLISRPEAAAAKVPASPVMSTMAGAAPLASSTSAVKPAATELVMHDISGVVSRTARRTEWARAHLRMRQSLRQHCPNRFDGCVLSLAAPRVGRTRR